MGYNLQPIYDSSDDLQTKDHGLTVVYGRRSSDGKLVPINIDDNGNLLIGTGVTLSAADLRIGAVEIQDDDSSRRVDVIQIGDAIPLPPYVGGEDNHRGFLILGRDATGNALPLSLDSTSGAVLVTPIAGVAEHWNGSVVFGTPATITFSGSTKSILINHTGTTVGENLLISFDGGVKFKTLTPGQAFAIDASHSSLIVAASAGTVPYEIVAVV